MKKYNSIDVRPYQLMCIICRCGAAKGDKYPHTRRLDEILDAVVSAPAQPLTLRCNCDTSYSFQNCGDQYDSPEGAEFNKRRDLTILQKLGLVPGDTRPALELFARIIAKIESSCGICGFDGGSAKEWKGCSMARSGNYEKARAQGVEAVIPSRNPSCKKEHKENSVSQMYDAKMLRIRPHHLMCITCFHGGKEELGAIEEDNLFEAIDIIQKNPDIPVKLVSGCCMICPPCSKYDPKTGWCVSNNAMGLRDEKKDLDVLQLLGRKFGDVLPAKELLELLYERIEETSQICGYGDGQTYGYEWTVCGGPDGSEAYRKGRQAKLGLPDAGSY